MCALVSVQPLDQDHLAAESFRGVSPQSILGKILIIPLHGHGEGTPRFLETAEEKRGVPRRGGSGKSPPLRQERSPRDVVMSTIASRIRQSRQIHAARFG